MIKKNCFLLPVCQTGRVFWPVRKKEVPLCVGARFAPLAVAKRVNKCCSLPKGEKRHFGCPKCRGTGLQEEAKKTAPTTPDKQTRPIVKEKNTHSGGSPCYGGVFAQNSATQRASFAPSLSSPLSPKQAGPSRFRKAVARAIPEGKLRARRKREDGNNGRSDAPRRQTPPKSF